MLLALNEKEEFMLDPALPFGETKTNASPVGVKRSRYTISVDNGDEHHLLYNTLSGQFLKLPSRAVAFLLADPEWEAGADSLAPIQKYLFEKGYLVPSDAKESYRSRMLYDSHYGSRQRLELILLPHENCNFRCTYCYETFARNKMEPWVREAVKKYVVQQAGDFRSLSVSWFGGEPLLAYDVIRELSACFTDVCGQHGASFTSQITTNAYLLDADRARILVSECGVNDFQITVDGPCGEHDKRRRLANGGGTYERVYRNLLALRDVDVDFRVVIRVNYDEGNAAVMDPFIDQLAEDFSADGRFVTHFFPISNWGGETVGALPLCDVNMARNLKYRYLDKAADLGFSSLIREEMKPMGSSCYAADPNSFVIGSDGAIYKCTVAFEDPRNKVGFLRNDGTMSIDLDKFGLWTVNEGVTDEGCQSCFFNPSCQGMACPLYRMQTGKRPCPPLKHDFPRALKILAKEMTPCRVPPSAQRG